VKLRRRKEQRKLDGDAREITQEAQGLLKMARRERLEAARLADRASRLIQP
jgi:hypothetical protein